VKEEVELRLFANFGEDLYEGVYRVRYMAFGSILHIQCTETMKADALVHGWKEIANVKTVLEQVPRPFLSTE
jgi:hypothetical protein